jgi:4-hydroxy-3-methylbut-2-en-1-yl diphosphate reductase
MRKFDTPSFFQSGLITEIKRRRNSEDSKKKDFLPHVLSYKNIEISLARHFGFCFGVENAVEIAYKALKENLGKRVFLLSQMIHNPFVNKDLVSRGVKFLCTPEGERIFPLKELTPEDIVILPAFGYTVDILNELQMRGVNPLRYNATCPFVERVWKKAALLGKDGYTIIIHGKHFHEETKATFSHAEQNGPALIIRNLDEAIKIPELLEKKISSEAFLEYFDKKYSSDFNPQNHLSKIGVVNQTTMLAEETVAITSYLKNKYIQIFGEKESENHFADTRDTLCYATSENQRSVKELLKENFDLAIVIGGFNSSNTAHLGKLLSTRFRTFHIETEKNILSWDEILHLEFGGKEPLISSRWLKAEDTKLSRALKICITAGASTPDSTVQNVIERLITISDSL